jgi:16S rRNA (guanine966-N2)-methyltransferase
MRIIGGRWRSRTIDWPDTGKTRPITDRVREAIFDSLGSHFDTPGGLPELNVADVFSGGGSLGLEALSRGASRACFFDRDIKAIQVLKANLKRFGAGLEAAAVVADIWRMAIRPPESFAPLDLVFLDPPFPDTRDMSDRSKVGTLLRRLGSSMVTRPTTLVVLRHEVRMTPPHIIGKYWTVQERREYGKNTISILQRCAAPGPADELGATSPETEYGDELV